MWRNCFMLDRNLTKFTRICSPLKHACMYKTSITNQLCDIRKFSTSSKLFCDTGGGLKKKPKIPPLMNNPTYGIRLVSSRFIVRVFKNIFSSCFIKYKYNGAFNIAGFKEGAKQAMVYVSPYLSKGEFEQLEGLIEPKALEEIKQNFHKLSEEQRKLLLVHEEDLIFPLKYDLSIRVDTDTGKEYAEARIVLPFFHGYTKELHRIEAHIKNKEKLDKAEMFGIRDDGILCIYILVKELTKDLEKDWIIHELNYISM